MLSKLDDTFDFLHQWRATLLIGLLAYLLAVQLLPFRRARLLERWYSPAGRSSFRHLTTNDTQTILKDLTELEFPKFFGFSIIFALLKACVSLSEVRYGLMLCTDLWNSKRIFSSRCDRTACGHKESIETDCRHRSNPA